MRFFLAAAFLSLTSISLAADFDARAAFGKAPGRDLDAALKRAPSEGKRVLVFTWDSRGDYNDQGLRIKYMTDLQETKDLLKANFTIVLLDRKHKDIESHIASQNSEQPLFVLFNNSGAVQKIDKVYANPTEGLRIVKELVAAK